MATHPPWWKEPMVWLIISLPLTAVIAGFITFWLAAREPDPLVKDDYYKQGLAMHQSEERTAHAAAAGLSAAFEAHRERITVRLSGNLERYPERIILTVVHPTRVDQDQSLTLAASGNGLYEAELPLLSAGQRQVILEPEDRYWRLNGHWMAPFAGQFVLGSAGSDTTTRP